MPRTPVHDVISAIDQALFVQPDKHLAHRGRKFFVHREVFAIPVDRRAQALHLVENRAAVKLFPFPDALDKLLAAQLAPLLAFFFEVPLHHHLRGDAGMIRSRQPQRDESAHPVPAHDDVHLRLVEHVTHVQPSSHIGRRQQQREHRPRLTLRRHGHGEEFFLNPIVGPARLNRARLVSFGQFVRHLVCDDGIQTTESASRSVTSDITGARKEGSNGNRRRSRRSDARAYTR